jgi:hypothetical protein
MIWSGLRGNTESQAETSWPLVQSASSNNANGPKVKLLASLSKTELYAGNSSTAARYSPVHTGSQNPTDRGTIRREGSSHGEPSETLRSDAS